MSDWRKTYWRFFNFAGRLVGAWFIFGGVVFILYGFASGGIVFIIPGLITTVFGILLIFAKPYRPDLRDSESAESHKKME
jgi:hypothetical protein